MWGTQLEKKEGMSEVKKIENPNTEDGEEGRFCFTENSSYQKSYLNQPDLNTIVIM
jgi:hypothetical protein